MGSIDEQNLNKEQEVNAQLEQIYKNDKQYFDNFVNGKTGTLDFSRIQRLVLSELSLNKSFNKNRILGFSRKQVQLMAEYPERYGGKILDLMDFMYQKSGYMKRLIDYFSNMSKINYYVDTEALTSQIYSIKESTLKNNYIKFSSQASKFNFSNISNEIFKRLYLNDVCYAFVIESKVDISFYFINPRYCQITGVVNGNVYKYAINRSLLNTSYFESLPRELQELLETSKQTSLNNLVDIPLENSFCLKYNNHFYHAYPPFFPMISQILSVEDYADLAKTKAVNDAYKLLVLKIPSKDGKLTMNDKQLSPYIKTALGVVQENIGVLPYPADVDSIEFSSSNSDDRDKVADAITQMYSEIGVSQSLMSGASSGSELKLSIKNDSGDIYRIYRMIENWVSLQMKLRNYIYTSYQFVYRILDMTIFDETDVIDEQLKIAQAGLPNKMKLCAAIGLNPCATLGNSIMESTVFKDVFDNWQPLRSSYTESGDTNTSGDGKGTVGAPQLDETELSPSGTQTREGDENNPDNRI